jgi:hypothetical protein
MRWLTRVGILTGEENVIVTTSWTGRTFGVTDLHLRAAPVASEVWSKTRGKDSMASCAKPLSGKLKMDRRSFLQRSTFALAQLSTRPALAGEVVELQKGDPQLPYERAVYDPERIRDMATRRDLAAFADWDKDLPKKMIGVAGDYVGVTRNSSPDLVAEFLRVVQGHPLDDKGNPNAFCAAGVSYCALKAYPQSAAAVFDSGDQSARLLRFRGLAPDLDHFFFYPTMSCADMYHIALGRHRWLDRSQRPSDLPKAGWIVLFNWKDRGLPDHCGIVTQATTSGLSTIEFNTSSTTGGDQRNSGAVAKKDRTYRHVMGFIADHVIV